jgi:hypothetical protein
MSQPISRKEDLRKQVQDLQTYLEMPRGRMSETLQQLIGYTQANLQNDNLIYKDSTKDQYKPKPFCKMI